MDKYVVKMFPQAYRDIDKIENGNRNEVGISVYIFGGCMLYDSYMGMFIAMGDK